MFMFDRKAFEQGAHALFVDKEKCLIFAARIIRSVAGINIEARIGKQNKAFQADTFFKTFIPLCLLPESIDKLTADRRRRLALFVYFDRFYLSATLPQSPILPLDGRFHYPEKHYGKDHLYIFLGFLPLCGGKTVLYREYLALLARYRRFEQQSVRHGFLW